MPDEHPSLTLAERLSAVERDILYVLASESGEQSIWTLPELGREVGDLGDATDAVRGLNQAGLIHKTSDGYIFASQAAVHVVQMVGHVV